MSKCALCPPSLCFCRCSVVCERGIFVNALDARCVMAFLSAPSVYPLLTTIVSTPVRSARTVPCLPFCLLPLRPSLSRSFVCPYARCNPARASSSCCAGSTVRPFPLAHMSSTGLARRRRAHVPGKPRSKTQRVRRPHSVLLAGVAARRTYACPAVSSLLPAPHHPRMRVRFRRRRPPPAACARASRCAPSMDFVLWHVSSVGGCSCP